MQFCITFGMTPANDAALTQWSKLMLQVVMEMNLGVQDEAPLQDAQLQRLAEREPQYWGHQLSGAMTPPKSVAAGPVRDLRFLDTQTCFWQLAQGQSLQHGATTSQGIPHLGELLLQSLLPLFSPYATCVLFPTALWEESSLLCKARPQNSWTLQLCSAKLATIMAAAKASVP